MTEDTTTDDGSDDGSAATTDDGSDDSSTATDDGSDDGSDQTSFSVGFGPWWGGATKRQVIELLGPASVEAPSPTGWWGHGPHGNDATTTSDSSVETVTTTVYGHHHHWDTNYPYSSEEPTGSIGPVSWAYTTVGVN